MSTNRRPRSWPLKTQITPEALALFLALEQTPKNSEKFRDGSRELARMLGLIDEWWSGNHVNDRSREPCHPPGYISREDWFRCRQVRQELLAASRQRPTRLSS
jgi:hypothetical protein